MPAPEFITITIGTRSKPSRSIVATRLIRAIDPIEAPNFETWLLEQKVTWVSDMPVFELSGWRYSTQSRGFTKSMKRVNIEEALADSNAEWQDVDDVQAREAWLAHIESRLDEFRTRFIDSFPNQSTVTTDTGGSLGIQESVSELSRLLDAPVTMRYT